MSLTKEQIQICCRRYDREMRVARLTRLNAPLPLMEGATRHCSNMKVKCEEWKITEEMYKKFCEGYHVYYMAEELEKAIRDKCLVALRHSRKCEKDDNVSYLLCRNEYNGCKHDCPKMEIATEQQLHWFDAGCNLDTGELEVD